VALEVVEEVVIEGEVREVDMDPTLMVQEVINLKMEMLSEYLRL
jgi:hypothetical protein